MRARPSRLKPYLPGFTLPELMITLAVASILAAAAAPAFRNIIAGQRIRTASFDLMANLTLARSEAIKQNTDVTVASADGTSSWGNGWSISSAGGSIKSPSAYSNVAITTGVGGPSSVVYNRNGRVTSSTAVSFQISDAAESSSVQPRCITLSATGQPVSKIGSCS